MKNNGFPYQYSDGGRNKSSRRSKQKNDCTVRALAIVTGISYDQAFELLRKAGRKSSKGYKLSMFFQFVVELDNSEILGYRINKITFPAIKGERRMNPLDFAQKFNSGRYIVSVAKHVFVFIDGIAFDEFKERNDRCIYTAWKFEKVE